MTCPTCIHCITTTKDITSPGNMTDLAVDFMHCQIHDYAVDNTGYCDDYATKGTEP